MPRCRTVAVLVGLLAVVLLVPSSVGAGDCWDPPLTAPIADPYREPVCRWCPGNRGIEFDTVPGQHVRAVESGRVTFSGGVAGTNYLVVEHADGRRVTYGRLNDVRLQRGDFVLRGALVGTAGDRFHLGVRDGDDYVDPTPFLGRRVYRVRLVPLDGSPGRSASSRLVCASLSQA